MVNYKNGKIYKIWSPSTNKIYIGSTTVEYLSQRLAEHVSDYKQWKKGTIRYISSIALIKLNDYHIELIELCPCNSRDELLAREGYYQRLYKDMIVNKFIADRTKKEWREDNRTKIIEQNKEYREKNKKKMQEYVEKNKTKISANKKIYYDKNKEKFEEYRKKYYTTNKDVILEKNKEKTQCECGSILTKLNIARHNKTKKHQTFLNNKNTD